jgi:hypothetical protein
VLLMAAIGVALNPAAAFAVGLPLAYAFKQKWPEFEFSQCLMYGPLSSRRNSHTSSGFH